MDEFIKSEPNSKKYFYKYYGSREFINKKSRYCLYIGNCSPAELKKMPKVMERVKKVKEFRASSKRKQTRLMSEKSTTFDVTTIPKDNFLVIPIVSS